LPSLPEHGRRLRNSARTEARASLLLKQVLAETPAWFGQLRRDPGRAIGRRVCSPRVIPRYIAA